MSTIPPTHPAPARRVLPSSNGERGLTLVEIIAVLAILAIIGAIGVRSMSGPRANTAAVKARVIALSMSEAVAQFQRDHGGRVPGNPVGAGAGDWNVAQRSPIDRSNGNSTYLKPSTVEALVDGTVSLESATGSLVGGGRASSHGRIRYVPDTGRNVFVVVAYAQRGGRLAPDCWVSPSAQASVASLLRTQGVTAKC